MGDYRIELSTVVHSAAGSLEERELIGLITDNLFDAAARQKYFEWLDARNDPRKFVVRELSDLAVAVESDDPGQADFDFAPREGFSSAWMEMQGYSLLTAIRNQPNLRAVKHVLLKYAMPTVSIQAETIAVNSLPPTASRFGGRPGLPVEMPWPSTSEGMLGFTGQIALEDIRCMQAARKLPAGGWLAFFVSSEDAGPNRQNDCGVYYFPPDTNLQFREVPERVPFYHQRNGLRANALCRLIFTETWDFPDLNDRVVSDEDRSLLLAAAPKFDFDTFRDLLRNSDNHLLGYSRHYRTEDTSPAADWCNLLCLGSIGALGWNWCDGEHLSYYIPQTDLAGARFDRVAPYAS